MANILYVFKKAIKFLFFQWSKRINEFNRNYVKPFLTAQTVSRGDEIVEKYEALEENHQLLRIDINDT